MKKALCLLLVFLFALTLVACGEEKTSGENGGTTTTTTTSASGDTAEPSESESDETTTSQPSTSSTAPKADYIIRNNVYFDAAVPVLRTDSDTQEQYYEMAYLTVEFYPNGGETMMGEFKKPVVMACESIENVLIPKYNCPKTFAPEQEWIMGEITQGDENSTMTWEEAFDIAKSKKMFKTYTYKNVEYLWFVPPLGGASFPLYSYTVNNENGKVTLTPIPDAAEFEVRYPLLSVTLKPTNEMKLVATYKIDGKTTTINMNGHKG